MLPPLKVSKVVFLDARDGKRFAWYLSIVFINSKPCCFWSHHECTGMGDMAAVKAFTREHFEEVGILISQQMRNEPILTNN